MDAARDDFTYSSLFAIDGRSWGPSCRDENALGSSNPLLATISMPCEVGESRVRCHFLVSQRETRRETNASVYSCKKRLERVVPD